ncbi:MAG: methyltransferase [Candidatus Izemoplasmatales bacterium]
MSEIFIHDLMAYDGLKILQRKDKFRFSLDSLLLADFVNFNLKSQKIIELGSGSGAILLYLSLKTDKKMIGIEIQRDVANLSIESIKYNKLDNQIDIINEDIRNIHNIFNPSSFDIVISNPPFFKNNDEKMMNENLSLSLSRHELSINFHEILIQTKRILKTGGSFYFVHRASRLEEIIMEMRDLGFVIKRIRFVYTKPKNDALMILVESRFNGKTGNMIIEEPLYVYNHDNQYTSEIKSIFHLGENQNDKKS